MAEAPKRPYKEQDASSVSIEGLSVGNDSNQPDKKGKA